MGRTSNRAAPPAAAVVTARNLQLLLGSPRSPDDVPDPSIFQSPPIRSAIGRLMEHRFSSGAHHRNLDWYRAVSSVTDSAEPRVLLRVDEFPYYSSFDRPDEYGVERATEFHRVLADAGVPYMMSIVPQLTRDPLNPKETGGRSLEAPELALIEEMRGDGVAFAQHGTTHRSRHQSPRRRSEFTGLSDRELGELLDRGAEMLADMGIECRVLVPPFNRFSHKQLDVFAERFDVVTGGPESVRFMGRRRGPMWLGDVVYLPCMPPLYGRARDILPELRDCVDAAPGVWIPVGLHVAWELDDDLVGLRELADYLGSTAIPWERFLDAVEASRSAS